MRMLLLVLLLLLLLMLKAAWSRHVACAVGAGEG